MNKTDKMILLGVKLYRQKHYLCARIIHFFLRLFRQCDISVEADISDNVHFCHKGFGIVINPNCKIGGGHCDSTLRYIGRVISE